MDLGTVSALKLKARRVKKSFIAKRSISYTPVSELHSCKCEVCTKQIKDKYPKPPPESLKQESKALTGEAKSFTWLMSTLGSISQTQLLNLICPETVFFKRSKPHFMLAPTKEKQVKLVEGDKFSIADLVKTFMKIVRRRKKDKNSENPETIGKEVVLLRYTKKGKNNSDLENNVEAELGNLRVMGEKEFFELIYERPGSSVWKSIFYIQTVVKSKNGIGETHNVDYLAPSKLDGAFENEMTEALQVSEDEGNIMLGSPKDYCYLLAKRIAALLYQHSNLVLLKGNFEFMQDDKGQIWFSFCKKIYVEEVSEKIPKRGFALPEITQEKINQLNKKLDQHVASNPDSYEKYSRLLNSHYQKVKKQADIDRVIGLRPMKLIDEEGIKFAKDKLSLIGASITPDKPKKKKTRTKSEIIGKLPNIKFQEKVPTSETKRKSPLFRTKLLTPELYRAWSRNN